MIKNLPCNAGDSRSLPGQETKIPCAMKQLILPTATNKPSSHNEGVYSLHWKNAATKTQYTQQNKYFFLEKESQTEDGGGIGQGDHFLHHKFVKRSFECWATATKQLLNTGRGHQALRKEAHSLWKETVTVLLICFYKSFLQMHLIFRELQGKESNKYPRIQVSDVLQKPLNWISSPEPLEWEH